MKTAFSTISLFSIVAFSSSAMADDLNTLKSIDAGYLEIQSVQVEEVKQSIEDHSIPEVPSIHFGLKKPSLLADDSLSEADVKLDLIINMGKKIWKIIEAGRPVVTTQFEMANALPSGVTSWEQMSGWKNPEARSYRVWAKNLYGITVVDFTYRVSMTSGGSYKGQGRYLTRVSTRTENLDVAWGYTFDASVEVPNITNAGTPENPVASMEMIVKWKMSTILKSNEGSASYLVRGDGLLKQL